MFEDVTRKSVIGGMVDLAEHITFLTQVLNCWERIVEPSKKEIMEFVKGETKQEPKKVCKKKKNKKISKPDSSKMAEWNATYYEGHRDEILEQKAEYYQKNKERLRKKNLARYYERKKEAAKRRKR